jgi:UDP-N-acetylglucosamine 2-epimerase (non-hydrolysing)
MMVQDSGWLAIKLIIRCRYLHNLAGPSRKMPRILTVIGTRPEAIKMAPLIRRLRSVPKLSVVVCSSGQHREMIKQVFDLFSIEPDIDLAVMQPDQKLGELTASVLTGMESTIARYRPDRLLVHGDTTTTLAAAIAAYYQKVPVGHVEAGLRTGNIYAPWPEEINRRIADTIADRLYAPTESSRANLLTESVAPEKIIVTGNTVIDALFDIVRGPLAEPATQRELKARFPYFDNDKKTILVTCHRRESYGDGFRDVCAALAQLAARPDVQIVFPIHRNPNVRAAFSLLGSLPNVKLIEPLDYLEFVYAQSKCYFILTDSGGVQEEAPSLGKPVLVMRAVTERPEAVAAGTVKLVGTNIETIVSTALTLIGDSTAYAAMTAIHNPYGDGKACERIIASLLQDFDYGRH